MIESIREAFEDMLDDAFYQRNRRFIDQQMKHTFHIKVSDVERALFEELKRVISKSAELEQDRTGTTTIPWDAKLAKTLCRKHAEKITSTAVWTKKLREKAKEFEAAIAGAQAGSHRMPNFKARGKWFTFLPGGKDIKFYFEAGEIDVRRGEGVKVNDLFGEGTVEKDSRAAALVKQTNWQFMADQFGTEPGKTVGGIGVRDEYIQKFKGKGHGVKSLQSDPDFKRGYSRGRARLTHGQTEQNLGGEEVRVKRGWLGEEVQGTVATLGLSREMKDIKSAVYDKETSSNASNQVFQKADVTSETLEYFENVLNKEYKLESFRDTKGNIDRSFWVQLELEGDQKAMRKYDRNGIKEFLREHDDILAKALSSHKKFQGIDLLTMKGSPSLKDDMDAIVPYLMSKGLLTKAGKIDRRKLKTTKDGGLDMRKTINKELVAKAKAHMNKQVRQKTSFAAGGKKKSKKISKRAKRVAASGAVKARAHQKSKVNAKAGQNPLALRGLINAALAKTIAGKMEAPALVYRTGRFAESAQVDNIMMGPRGKTMIDYTYMKMPYQTFEPGFAQGSINRDPRRIIGESIREIAQSIMGDKFLHIRRV